MFEKLALTTRDFEITLDSLGNLFLRSCIARFPRFCGDYRGKLNDTTFKNLKNLIAKNRMDSVVRKYSEGLDYVLFYGDKVYEGSEYSDNARHPIRYLIQSLKHQPLRFQNFVLGDSVDGMLLIQPMLSYHYVSSGTLHKIGSYKSDKRYKYGAVVGGYVHSEPIAEEGQKVELNIYRFNLGKVYYGEEVVRPGPIYILSDTALVTGKETILVFQHETPHPLYSERNGPAVCVPIRQLDMPAPEDTVIVPRQPGFIGEPTTLSSQGGYGAEKKWVKLFWGLIKIRVKSDLAKAYKRQILKDWEKFHEENEN